MVRMGEYSDGCICQVKGKQAAAADASNAAAAIPAAAGVYMQMAAAAAAQEASMSQSQRAGTPQQHPYVPGSPVGSPGWRPGMP